jgi:hypothetical protein
MGDEGGLLLGEVLLDDAAGGGMDPDVGDLGPPPFELPVQVVEVAEGPAEEELLAGASGAVERHPPGRAYGGFGELYAADRHPEPITEALCWVHARRKFFELAGIAANARRGKDAPPISPLALEAVKRIDAVFDLERAISGARPVSPSGEPTATLATARPRSLPHSTLQQER